MHDDVNTELNFNPSELANLTNLAIGSRKIESFCKSSNLSRSFVSKVLNCRLPAIPRKRSLYKLASASNGRVTANQLLLACGYGEETANPVSLSVEAPAPKPAMQPNAIVIISDDITEILTKIKEISEIDTTLPIVVLATKLDTLILLKQFFQSNNDINIQYALVVE